LNRDITGIIRTAPSVEIRISASAFSAIPEPFEERAVSV